MQGGIVRLQLAKILTGKEDVRYEHSSASGQGIRAVSHEVALALCFVSACLFGRLWYSVLLALFI